MPISNELNDYFMQGLHTAVFSSCEDIAKDRNNGEPLAWSRESRETPCTRCLLHTGYLVHGLINYFIDSRIALKEVPLTSEVVSIVAY